MDGGQHRSEVGNHDRVTYTTEEILDLIRRAIAVKKFTRPNEVPKEPYDMAIDHALHVVDELIEYTSLHSG